MLKVIKGRDKVKKKKQGNKSDEQNEKKNMN